MWDERMQAVQTVGPGSLDRVSATTPLVRSSFGTGCPSEHVCWPGPAAIAAPSSSPATIDAAVRVANRLIEDKVLRCLPALRVIPAAAFLPPRGRNQFRPVRRDS